MTRNTIASVDWLPVYVRRLNVIFTATSIISRVRLTRTSRRRRSGKEMARLHHFRRSPSISGFAFDFSRVTKKPSFLLDQRKSAKAVEAQIEE